MTLKAKRILNYNPDAKESRRPKVRQIEDFYHELNEESVICCVKAKNIDRF